ncbi:MAG: TlpA family protein disulfide reductase [Acidobacteria bacterium]|nr:TlpA family protein disulfide reductase [Acidobacteriota bacterium]
MHRKIGLFALLLLGTAAAAAPRALVPIDEAGYRKLIASGKGQVLLVDFWATWCAPCRAEMPQLVKLEKLYSKRGLKLVTVSANEPEQEAEAASFIDQQHVTGLAYIKRAKNDDKFIDAIDPKWSGALPALFLYDRQGRKARAFIGETDLPALEKAIQPLLGQR